jgi:hypothetical protein
MGDPAMQALGQMGQPPNPAPNPGAPPGQGAAPGQGVQGAQGGPEGQPPPPQSNLQPIASPAPDPIISASTGQLLLKAQRQEELANSFNRDMQLISSGFGTGEQQRAKTAALSGMLGPSNVLGQIAEIQKLQQTGFEAHQQQQFAANAEQALLAQGYSPQVAHAMAFNPQLATSALTPSDLQKNVEFYVQNARANNVPESVIQDNVQQIITQSIGHQDPIQKDFNQAWNLARKQNPTLSDSQILAQNPELKDLITYQGAKTQEGKVMADAAEDKNNAIVGYTSMDNNYKNVESALDWLNAHPAAAATAIHYPDWTTRGIPGEAAQWLSSWLPGSIQPVTEDVAKASGYLDQLRNATSAEKMSEMKNIRTQREFNAIGGSVSNLWSKNASAGDIADQLKRLQTQTYNGHATGIMAAGKSLSGANSKYSGYGDSVYTQKMLPNGKINPVYNGGSDPNNFKGMSQDEAQKAYNNLNEGEIYVGTDGRQYTKHEVK